MYIHPIDTGWYYLQSRYYNPEWGRFINADGYLNANGGFIGFNLFAYCNNSPIVYIDPSGESAVLIFVLIGIVGISILFGLTGCSSSSSLDQQEADRKMLDPGSFDTAEEALNAGLNYAKECSGRTGVEYGGYVFERNERYYYKAGADIRYSHSQKNVFEINIATDEELISVFHTHPFHKENTVFSLVDYRHAQSHGVDAYVIDNEGCIYCLPASARNQTEYYQIR